jgi:hypothetical protein
VKTLIREAEETLVSGVHRSKELAPLRNILAEPSITDVISLNLDLLLEKMVSGRTHLSTGTSLYEPSVARKYLIRRSGGAGLLRVWHPHGDRSNKKTLSFGMWRYEQLLAPIGGARAYFKKAERDQGYGVNLKDDFATTRS